MRELAERLQAHQIRVSESFIGQVELGKCALPEKYFAPLESVLGLSAGYLSLYSVPVDAERNAIAEGVAVVNRLSSGVAVDYERFGTDLGRPVQRIDATGISSQLAFALDVFDESMAPHLAQGDTVVLTPVIQPTRGEVVLAWLPETAKVRCFLAAWYPVDATMVRLVKTNPAYESLIVRMQDIGQLAKVIERRVRNIRVEAP